MSQLAYNTKSGIAFEGMLADLQNNDVVSRANGEASADIPFGIGVTRLTDTEVDLPTLIGDHLVGVSVHSHAYDNRDPNQAPEGVRANQLVSVLRQGVVWVRPEDAVTEGGAVFMRISGVGQQGAFRGADVAAETV